MMNDREHDRMLEQFDKFIVKEREKMLDVVQAFSKVMADEVMKKLEEERKKSARNRKFGL